MAINKIILLIVSGALLTLATAAQGGHHPAHGLPAGRTQGICIFELSRNAIAVAKNELQPAESNNRPITENKDQSPKSEAADKENAKKSSNDTQRKPLKPFKPSEEIAAEQAVDFPVDI
jgi:hypothetical protein